MKKQRANIYIDGANMFYAQQKMGWFIDWQKVQLWLAKKYQINEIRFYIGKKKQDKKQEKFYKKLKKYGYVLITKPIKKIYSGELGKYFFKANLDVEIAVDMVLDVGKYEIALLFSGDSDFEYVIQKIKTSGRKTVVVGIERSISKELKKCAGEVVLLSGIRSSVEYK